MGLGLIVLYACQAVPLEIRVENQSSLPVCEVYLSPQQQTDFGENQLAEGEMIASGEQHTFILEAGEYDLLVRDCSEETLYSEASISQNRHIILGGEGKIPLRVTNQTDQEICYLYISTGEEWGEDRLGKVESILPGSKRIFFIPPAVYHARALDCDENLLAKIEAVNLSDSFEWVISP
ncbi:MAG: hypothetical protein N2646_06265 [Bellilinea sp.]|nr:hypothetical protein [Bellilinea sp.]